MKSWTQASDFKPAWASMPCKWVEAKGVVAVFSFWFFVFSNGTWTRYWDWGDCLNCDLGGLGGWAVICLRRCWAGGGRRVAATGVKRGLPRVGQGRALLACPSVGLPDVVGDVVFGAEVEDVLFVLVVLFVGVEGVYREFS